MAAPFLVVGESLVDVVMPADGATPHEAVGGSCLNVAVGLGRLDVATTLVTRIGEDDHGRRVAEHARRSGVRLADGSVVSGRTSTATAHLDAGGAATYDFDVIWDLPEQPLPEGTVGIHVGSLGAALEPGRSAVRDLVRRAAVADLFVSYDPNIRPAFLTDREAAWRGVLDLASDCRLVKLSDEDLRLLRPGIDEDEVCQDLLAAGTVELVVLTRGEHGARAYSEGSVVEVAAPPTRLVDTVGAGDSFMAAMLALLVDWGVVAEGEGSLRALDDRRVQLLVRGAAQAAALTCSRRGAEPPTRRELPATWPAG